MPEPIDVLDGTLPPEEPENSAPPALGPPPVDKVEALRAGVAAAKQAVIPDKKPEKKLPGVKATLKEVKELAHKRYKCSSKSAPLTPITPVTPSAASTGVYMPTIEAVTLLTKGPEYGPENIPPPPKDDGSPPESKVEQALEVATPKPTDVPVVAAKAFNRNRASLVLLDAFAMGDAGAAQKWNVHKSTITGYRERLATDPEFCKILTLRYAELEQSWSVARLQCLRAVIKRIEELAAKSEDIYRLAGAVKVLGELQVVAGVLNGPEAPGSSGSNAEAPRAGSRGPGPVFERLDK